MVLWWHNPVAVAAFCAACDAIAQDVRERRPKLVHSQHVRRSPKRGFMCYVVTKDKQSEVREVA
jgi:hypothetical protein